jgi:hypothetical protein
VIVRVGASLSACVCFVCPHRMCHGTRVHTESGVGNMSVRKWDTYAGTCSKSPNTCVRSNNNT